MAKFRLIGAQYIDKDGKVYNRGAVVESDLELDKLFANGWERVSAMTKKPNDLDESPDTSGKVMDPPEHKKQAIAAARAPAEKEAEDKTQKVASEPDFDPESKSKPAFPISSESPRKDEHGDVVDDEPDDEDEEAESGEESEEDGLGVDVTSQFADAKKADLLVFKNGGKYHVADKDDPTKPVRKTPFANKGDVGKYLKSQLKE